MDMVEIIHPTLDEYMAKIRNLANKYHKNPDAWYTLSIEDIPENEEDDRDDFRFIRMALWNQLSEKEFLSEGTTRFRLNQSHECTNVEPGANPGSTFWSKLWALTNMRISLSAI